MAIVMMAFFVSCIETPEEKSKNDKVDSYIDPLVDDKVGDTEARLIEKACVALSDKKRLFNSYYSNNTNDVFSFEGMNISCNGVKSPFQSSAYILGSGSSMSYRHSSSFGIKDIIFDDSSDIEDYCDTFVKDRYIVRGSRLRSIKASKRGNTINIVLATAQKNSDGKFKTFLTDNFIVASGGSRSQTDGLILQRDITDTSVCNRGKQFRGMKMIGSPIN